MPILCPALILTVGVVAAAQTPSTAASPDLFVQEWRTFDQRAANRAGAPAPPGVGAAANQNFDAVLEQVEAAQVRLVNGQPDAFKALWSHGDDVTLSGGLGGVIARGWTQVSERLDWVATQYLDGVRTHQEVARSVGQDLAYVVLRETIQFKSPVDRRPMRQELRVTQVFRLQGGRWLIVHRHADSQVIKATTG